MNALTVLSIAAVAACASAQFYGYPGVYGAYPGIYSKLWNTATPVTYKAAAHTPLAYSVSPFTPLSPGLSKFHAQDEFGQYSFGYAGGPASRAESRDAFGIVRGSYNYIDSYGKVQTQHYVADALGFRVAGTNLPVAPDAPEPVQDTPEVTQAKAVLKTLHDEAAAAAAAAPDSRKKRSVTAIHTSNTYSPFHPYGFPSPLSYGHPAVVGSPLPYTAGFPTYATTHGVTPYTGFPGVTPYTGFPGVTPYAGFPGVTPYAGFPGVTPYAGFPALGYAAAAPAAVRDAEVLRIEHNPGHSVSYRVD